MLLDHTVNAVVMAYRLGAPPRNCAHCSGFQASLRNLGATPSLSAEYLLQAISLAKFTKSIKYQWPLNTPSQGFWSWSMYKKTTYSSQCLNIHITQKFQYTSTLPEVGCAKCSPSPWELFIFAVSLACIEGSSVLASDNFRYQQHSLENILD